MTPIRKVFVVSSHYKYSSEYLVRRVAATSYVQDEITLKSTLKLYKMPQVGGRFLQESLHNKLRL